MRNGLTVGEGLAPPALLIYLFCNGRTKALPYGAKRSQPKFTTLNYTANPEFILLTDCKYNFSYVFAALEDSVSLGGILNGEHFIYRGFN